MNAASSRWVTTTKRVVGRAVDALVLGAVPEDEDALAEALKNGRTANHGWCRASAFGHSVTNGGCVRMRPRTRRNCSATSPMEPWCTSSPSKGKICQVDGE